MKKTDIEKILKKYAAGLCTSKEEQIVQDYIVKHRNSPLVQQFLEQLWAETLVEANHPIQESTASKKRYQAIQQKTLKKPLFWVSFQRVAAAVLILASLSSALYYLNPLEIFKAKPIEFAFYETHSGEIKKIYLPDSSIVWLNNQSSVRFPKTFSSKNREVYLKGEAYFEVTKNKHKPFYVHASKVYTQVLGTEFVVKSYEAQKNIQITLVEGKVAVGTMDSISTTKKQFSVLKPNEQLSINLNKNTYQKKRLLNAQKLTWWKEGKFVFSTTPITEIVKTFERWYGVPLKIEGFEGLQKLTFTSTLNKNTSLENNLKILCATSKKMAYTVTQEGHITLTIN